MSNLGSNRITIAIRQTAVFLDRWQWLLLAVAAPFLVFSTPGRSPVLFVVPGLWLIAWLAGRQPLPRTPLNAALLLMFCMVLVSLWVTYDVVVSLPKISGIVLGLGIFFTFARAAQTPRGWWLGLLVYLGIGFGIAVVGVLGTRWLNKIAILAPIVSRLAPRITGLPGVEEGFHPNSVAGALLWVIPCFLAFSWLLLTRVKAVRGLFGGGKTITISVLMIAASVWTLAVFILTQSRGGYIGLALTLPVLVLIALPRKARWYSLAILAVLAIALGILVATHWSVARSLIIGNTLAADPAFFLDTFKGRLEVWSRALYGIQDFPLTGMGMNTFRKLMPDLYPLFTISPGLDIGHAHNEFLQAALDLGIPGLIAFIALYIGAFGMLIRTWQFVRVERQSESRGHRNPALLKKPGGWFSSMGASPLADAPLAQVAVLGLGGGLLAHLLWGLTDAMALGSRPAFLFWVVLGLISGLHGQAQAHSAVVAGSGSTSDPQNGLRI